jgi:hypothetical protein
MTKALILAVLGVIAGLLAMALVVGAVEWLGMRAYPLPAGLDPAQPADLARILSMAPLGALLCVVAAWIAGAFVGGAVAASISRQWPRLAAVCVALAVVAASLAMQLDISGHPLWMTLAGVALPVPAALLAARVVRGRHRGATTT